MNFIIYEENLIFFFISAIKAKEAEPGKDLKSLKIKKSRVLYNLLRLTGGCQIPTSYTALLA